MGGPSLKRVTMLPQHNLLYHVKSSVY